MNSSRPKLPTETTGLPTVNSPLSFTEGGPEKWPSADRIAAPGSLNDAGLVTQVIGAAMKKCPLSRAEIADRMAYFTGTKVTETMLNQFTASRDDVRFPLQLERAFCAAVGDYTLLTSRAELAGLRFVDDEGAALVELGREYLRQKRAAENIAAIETKLRGVEL